MTKQKLAIMLAAAALSAPWAALAIPTASEAYGAIAHPIDTFAPRGSLAGSLIPSQKNCNYVTEKRYQPFSDIDGNFPGAKGLKLIVDGSDGKPCVDVRGNAAEGLLKLLFTTAITAIIVLTVINISVSGIQYMTEQATGQVRGGARKRLRDSLVALALGLLSYTILYTINRQLVNFSFNPASIDLAHSVDRGIESAEESRKDSGAVAALIEAARPAANTNPYGNLPASPTSWIDVNTKLPCTPTIQINPGVANNPCVQQNSLLGAYAASGGVGGVGQTPGTDLQAKFISINNSTLNKASADGTLFLNGVSYAFRSGGGGNGYLPVGTYTITNGRLRNDVSSMMIDGFGYSFDLSDAFDPRTSAQRELLRIHPDGGAPGTIGCIGIQGSRAVQEQFYNSLKNLLATSGGKYTIRVGM